MKIKDNKKYQRIFCAPKTESFCGFQSCKFLQTSKSKDFDSSQKPKVSDVFIK